MSASDFRKLTKKNNVSGRKPRAVDNGNRKAALDEEYKAAIQTIRLLQGAVPASFFGSGDVEMSIKIHSQSKADGTNIFKGIEDSLNKIAYDDDRQVRTASREFC
jgi:Holliday junction resolvase RusA-like endonuclease